MGGEQRESAEGLGQGKPTKGALGSFCALITFPGPFLELDLAPGSTVGGGGCCRVGGGEDLPEAQFRSPGPACKVQNCALGVGGEVQDTPRPLHFDQKRTFSSLGNPPKYGSDAPQ